MTPTQRNAILTIGLLLTAGVVVETTLIDEPVEPAKVRIYDVIDNELTYDVDNDTKEMAYNIIHANSGIQDKNGKDIFDSDIVLTPEGEKAVVYSESEGWFYRVEGRDPVPLDSKVELTGEIFIDNENK